MPNDLSIKNDLSIEPFDETADEIRQILLDAELPALLPALAHLTGDASLLAEELRPPLRPMTAAVEPQGGMSPEAQEKARELALKALLAFRDGGYQSAPDPTQDELTVLAEFITGKTPGEYRPLLSHELGLPTDMGRPEWSKDEIAPERPFAVLVIGAGQSGLVAAHRMGQAGIEYVVLEKNPDVGGTWYENSYPGCRLDTSNFAYSFSFEQKNDWREQFSSRDPIFEYFSGIADKYDLRGHIRFETEVDSVVFDDETELWTVTSHDVKGGAVHTDVVNAVITAVGQLNRPNLPDIPGRDTFEGPAFHTARWDHSVDVTGKRVAVVGTGASAFQVVPAIVDDVSEMLVFQRTPPWLQPTPTYHEAIKPGLHWLFDHVPYYNRWFRFYQFWISVEGRRPVMVVDPEWKHDVSISPMNEEFRQFLVHHLETQFGDRPDLLAKVMPNYTPGAKRMMRDNGVYPAALKREHVHLITDGITEITPTGIRTADAVLHEVDIIVYATGFKASEFLSPMKVTGRGGVEIHDQWDGEARAYMGIHVPNFPNLFIILGPNTNLVINGSILLFSELATHYILECFKYLFEEDKHTVDVRQDVHDAFNEKVDVASRGMAWGASNVNSWYKNANGRVSQVWPYQLVDYWDMTREPRLDELVIT
jgi:4-hydroxyacetophenone monooxygenase